MLKNIKPERVFHYFQEISKIPRCSGNEKEISNYLKNFAEERSLYVIQDDFYNIVIRKPASKGIEGKDGVVLQGHMDMVCEKSTYSKHCFCTDPIELKLVGNKLSANETTLGADDGIALAIGLAILEDDSLIHPDLELFITSSEETDMSGALNFKAGILRGKKLINIDSEEDWILTVGSCGGINLAIRRDVERDEFGSKAICLSFDGLLGGHSGSDIDKAKGNSLKVMARFLRLLKEKEDFRIVDFKAGNLDNAIPRDGKVILAYENLDRKNLETIREKVLDEFRGLEGDLKIDFLETDIRSSWKEDLTLAVIDFINDCPNGVNSYVKGGSLVESSDNLAFVREEEGKVYFEISIRSSSEQKKAELLEECKKTAKRYGFNYETGSEYPGWDYREDSPLRDMAQLLYKKMFGKEYLTLVIHAGLECGAISSKYKDMDMISIGPNISNPHTPKEFVEVDSVERVYNYILKLLEELSK